MFNIKQLLGYVGHENEDHLIRASNTKQLLGVVNHENEELLSGTNVWNFCQATLFDEVVPQGPLPETFWVDCVQCWNNSRRWTPRRLLFATQTHVTKLLAVSLSLPRRGRGQRRKCSFPPASITILPLGHAYEALVRCSLKSRISCGVSGVSLRVVTVTTSSSGKFRENLGHPEKQDPTISVWLLFFHRADEHVSESVSCPSAADPSLAEKGRAFCLSCAVPRVRYALSESLPV